MAKPTVLFINRVYPPQRGATGRVLQELAHGFVAAGWHVRVVSTGEKTSLQTDGHVQVQRIKANQKPRSALSYTNIWRTLYGAAKKMDAPDLLITLSDPPLTAVMGQRLQRYFDCPHMHWCHDYYPNLLPALGVKFPAVAMKMIKRLSMSAMAGADRLVVIGRCMARTMALEGFNPGQITVIPNWPDMLLSDQASGAPTAPKPSRHYSDIAKPFEAQLKSAPKFRVLYAGNLGHAHPVDTILDAAEILNTQGREIEFVFVGEGPKFNYIADERQRRGLDNIRLLPYQPDGALRDLMESGDVHLISMDERAAGLLVPCKLYSGLAVQRPCIFVGPAMSEAAKVITDFKAGTVVPQGRAEDLAARIKHYRINSREWFSACKGAAEAAQTFTAAASIEAFTTRARALLSEAQRTALDATMQMNGKGVGRMASIVGAFDRESILRKQQANQDAIEQEYLGEYNTAHQSNDDVVAIPNSKGMRA